MLKIRPDRRLAHSRLTKERNKEEKIKQLIAGYVVYYTLTPPGSTPIPPLGSTLIPPLVQICLVWSPQIIPLFTTDLNTVQKKCNRNSRFSCPNVKKNEILLATIIQNFTALLQNVRLYVSEELQTSCHFVILKI